MSKRKDQPTNALRYNLSACTTGELRQLLLNLTEPQRGGLVELNPEKARVVRAAVEGLLAERAAAEAPQA
jgi:hypothetical protein